MYTNRMKVVLINPYHPEWGHSPSLGLAYLAAVLERKNIPVAVIDMCAYRMGMAELKNKIQQYNADVVGVTATTPQIYGAFEIARIVKEVTPECKVVFGGVHPTTLPEESLDSGNVDYVVRGEGEITFLLLVTSLASGNDVQDIKGLSYHDKGHVIHNPSRPLIDNLDMLPYPARHLFPFPEAYYSPMVKGKQYADIFTSRGCTGTCVFCNHSVFGFKFRARSPENVLGEMEYLINRYRVDEFHIADDSFSYDMKRAIRICDMIIERKWNIKIACSGGLRVDCITSQLMEKLREAGCYRVHFGIESGSERILKKIGKQITLDQVREAFRMAHEQKMITVGLFMLGNYGEDKSTMEETIAFAKTLHADFSQFTMTTPFPGSALYKILNKHSMILTKDWDKYGIYKEPIYKTDELDQNLIIKMYKKAYRELYFNPTVIWGKIKNLRNWGDIKIAVGGAWRIIQRALVN